MKDKNNKDVAVGDKIRIVRNSIDQLVSEGDEFVIFENRQGQLAIRGSTLLTELHPSLIELIN